MCKAELDTHANTCGVNDVARILEYTGQVAKVSWFTNSLESIKDVPVVKAALAYDHPVTGEAILLVINQVLYFGNQLDHVLLNPNQLRAHGFIVEDILKCLARG